MNGQLPLQLGIRPSLRLSDYLPGPNREAVAAVTGMLAADGNPQVYISGAPGMGKTHLLVGLCEQAEELDLSAVYLPLREIDQWQPAMFEGLEAMDLIACDDVQLIAGRADWEQALFALYNRARDLGRRLLFSADRGPASLPIALPDLRSRLSWGAAYHLQPLADDDKIALLQAEAGRRGLQLADGVASYILQRCPRSTAELFALLDRLDRAALAAQRRLTLPFVREQLQHDLGADGKAARV